MCFGGGYNLKRINRNSIACMHACMRIDLPVNVFYGDFDVHKNIRLINSLKKIMNSNFLN